MQNINVGDSRADKLIFAGILLFLLGLVIGLFVPLMANPRMGLTTHLEGVMNGMLLVIIGLIWEKISLGEKWLKTIFWLFIYGSFANFTAVLIAAITGAGKLMPIAGGKEGHPVTELIISFLLISLAVAMIGATAGVLSGLYRNLKKT